MSFNKISVRTRLWIDLDEKPFLGAGRIKLLEEINQKGSITAAAKSIKMSYRQAWEHINNMNEIYSKPLVKTITGGKNGGGAVITEEAIDVIKRYKELEKTYRQFSKNINF